MSDAELHERMKAHAMLWKKTGEILEAERHERVRNANTARALNHLGELFNSAVYLHPPSESSGFVEFYRILGLGRR